jgi:hypothetical protein
MFEPLEGERLYLMIDERTGAHYCECHIKAQKLLELSTIDVPLDPDEQPEYRANRELVEDHVAFEKMREDAIAKRTFSNLVAEYNTSYDSEHPLKIIGGQHRWTALREALEKGADQYHGVKVYFGLDPDQRLDVQLISNTNIAVSQDLFDRMQETLSGPELRDWCQKVGLLPAGTDFADKRERARPLTVRAARTFIVNYFRGKAVADLDFEKADTTPTLPKTGVPDGDWEELKSKNAKLFDDPGLREAGREFAALMVAQRKAFSPEGAKKGQGNIDFAEKAHNYAVISGWAFVAGCLHANKTRRDRHFGLKSASGKDPLNAAILAKGRHRTDPENYRGLGYRTDAKERGRIVELFYLQAEKGDGISAGLVDLAIKKYHAKQAHLEVKRAEGKS